MTDREFRGKMAEMNKHVNQKVLRVAVTLLIILGVAWGYSEYYHSSVLAEIFKYSAACIGLGIYIFYTFHKKFN